MPAYWCVNFDGEAGPLGDKPREDVLNHGLRESMWLMQYQYSDETHNYQGHPRQRAATTRNWNQAGRVQPGDWIVAYLPESTFYAVGEVIEPRVRPRHTNQPNHQDSISRTVSEHRH